MKGKYELPKNMKNTMNTLIGKMTILYTQMMNTVSEKNKCKSLKIKEKFQLILNLEIFYAWPIYRGNELFQRFIICHNLKRSCNPKNFSSQCQQE